MDGFFLRVMQRQGAEILCLPRIGAQRNAPWLAFARHYPEKIAHVFLGIERRIRLEGLRQDIQRADTVQGVGLHSIFFDVAPCHIPPLAENLQKVRLYYHAEGRARAVIGQIVEAHRVAFLYGVDSRSEVMPCRGHVLDKYTVGYLAGVAEHVVDSRRVQQPVGHTLVVGVAIVDIVLVCL